MSRLFLFFFLSFFLSQKLYAQAASEAELCETGDAKACNSLGWALLKGENKNPKESTKYFERACALEHWDACSSLANAHENGRGVPKNQTQANAIYEKACAKDDDYACYSLGHVYEFGKDKTKDRKKAAQFYSKACDLGRKTSCENAGIALRKTKQYKAAAKRYRQACDAGKVSSCHYLSELYYWHHLGKDKKANQEMAFKIASEACNRSLDQCPNLAKYYFEGIGTPKNRIRAIPLYEKLCEDDGDACNTLGYAFEEEKEYKKAHKFYKLGCEKKEAYSCSNIANLYRKGLGTEKNLKLTEHFLKLACNLEHGGACSRMAFLYNFGKEIEKNEKLSTIYFEKACDLDSANGCAGLGLAYVRKGVKRDLKKSTSLFRKACDLGSHNGCANLARAYKQGLGVEKDKKVALTLHTKNCVSKKSPASCLIAGSLLRSEKEYQAATSFFQKACDGGERVSCLKIAYLRENGHLRNPENSASEYKKLCEGGYREACVALGRLHLLGRFVELDPQKAETLLEAACPTSIYSCILLAKGFRYGPTTPQRSKRRKILVQEICRKRRAEGCTLHHLILQKTGTEVERKEALEYFKSWCKLDDRFCGELALSYRHGLGVKQDSKKAEQLLKKTTVTRKKYCEDASIFSCIEIGELYQQFEKPKEAKKFYQKACKLNAKLGCKLAKSIP